MTPEELAQLIRDVLVEAAKAGSINLEIEQVPEKIVVERPRVREHGEL